jgi:hypothetical protein
LGDRTWDSGGKIDPRSFGDHAVQTKPLELQEKLTKFKAKEKAHHCGID